MRFAPSLSMGERASICSCETGLFLFSNIELTNIFGTTFTAPNPKAAMITSAMNGFRRYSLGTRMIHGASL